MKRLNSAIRHTVLPICLSMLYLFGCAQNPADSDGTIDPAAKQAEALGKTGVSIYQNINSFKQMDNFKSGKIEIEDFDINDFGNGTEAMKFGKIVKKRALASIQKRAEMQRMLLSAANDSVIFDFTERDTSEGVTRRIALFYDTASGNARLVLVGSDYSDAHIVEYDSTELIVNLNHTIFDDSDDVLLSIESQKRYKAGQLVQEEKGKFTPDAHAPGTEPEGGVLTGEVTYSSSSFISKTTNHFEFHPETGGSFEKTSVFSDGKSSREAATFNADGTGTFEEDRRDGTQIRGTFEGAEDDGSGSYSITTTYPAGHDPVSVAESADFDYDAATETVSGSFERTINRLDGTVETESAAITQSRDGEILVTTISSQNIDGSHGTITITETPDLEQVTGEWTDADGTFVVFKAQTFGDESVHFEADQYASKEDYDNKEAPAATAVFDFYPDGSGSGVVTEGEDVYDVVISPDGSVTITKRN